MTGPNRIRAFLALEIPDSVRQTIRREQNSIKHQLPRARWTRPEGQHLTLKFLGEATVDALSELTPEITARLAGLPAVSVQLSGAGFFPSVRRSRVAWIGGRARGGSGVASAVEAAAAKAGFEADRRAWALHLTQARLNRPWPKDAVETFLEWGRGLDFKPFTCREVILFSSKLQPSGALYTPLERFPLE